MFYDPWATLQMFADGGGEGSGAGGSAGGQTAAPSGDSAAAPKSGVSPADAGQDRLRELGVPEDVLRRRSERNKGRSKAPETANAAQTAPAPSQPSSAAPEAHPEEQQEAQQNEPTLDDMFREHPSLQKEFNEMFSKRVKGNVGAAEALEKLSPFLSLYAQQQGVEWDPAHPDYDVFSAAAREDDSLYEPYALEHGCTIEEARQAVQQDIMFDNHITKMKAQAIGMQQKYPGFDLAKELKDPRFVNMTSPGGGLSLEDAYWAIHRDELMAEHDRTTVSSARDAITASIRSGSRRPVEAGAQSQAPSNTSFQYSSLSRSEREAFKANLERSWGRGQKVYPPSRG